MPSLLNQQSSKAIPTILLAGFVAGTLDITAACTQFYLKTHKDPTIVLRYIASGFFGNEAMSGGMSMNAWGLFFHYLIAFGLTIFFFWIFPKVKIMSKNLFVTGMLYGIFAWAVTTRIIVRLSRITQAPFNAKNAAIATLILMFCIGLPISLIIGNYYRRKRLQVAR